jgi:hypothetical protein
MKIKDFFKAFERPLSCDGQTLSIWQQLAKFEVLGPISLCSCLAANQTRNKLAGNTLRLSCMSVHFNQINFHHSTYGLMRLHTILFCPAPLRLVNFSQTNVVAAKCLVQARFHIHVHAKK